MEVIEVIEKEIEVIEVIERGPQGPQGAGITTLTTQGDLLYRGATTGERLPIGTTGQILKVSSGGIPEWGAAPSSGVSSVSGTSPIVSSGGATPAISITAATTSAAGSMSAADKTKLDGIASGAEVNVNADWNASSGDSQILNKPTIPSTAADVGAVPTSRTISAGTGLTGGGDLSANRTLAVSYGATAGTACQGNDGRIAYIASGKIDQRISGFGSIGTLNMTAGDGISGSINTSDGGGDASGGSINTSGHISGSFGGGINTSAGVDLNGGSLDLSQGGGSINTRGTGSIQFGEVGTRTTLTGTATADRAISLPDAAGTLALTSNITKTAVGLGNVTNNAQTQAAIVPNTAPSAGQLLVGNAGGTAYAPATLSGDATIASTGALTLANTSTARTNIGLGNVANVDTTNAANISSGVLPNARVNWAAPSAIGSTTAAAITGTTGAFTTLSANNGTLTASAPVLDLSQTWNNAAVTFTGMRFNVTNTASDSNSLFAEFQIGGLTQFSVRNTGEIRVRGTPKISNLVGATWATWITGTYNNLLQVHAPQINLGADGSGSTRLYVDAAHTFAQRDGTNAQTFRIYNTFTDASNYERAKIAWSSNVLQIGTEAGGTGSNRSLEIRQSVSSNWGFSIFRDTTRILGSFDNDIFCDSATTFGWSSRLRLTAPADGRLLMRDNAATGFDRLQFGGTTSSFPALKRSSTALQVRLADDTADAPLSCGALTVSGNITHTGSLTLASTSTGNIIFNTNSTTRWQIGGSSGALVSADGVPIRLGGSTSSFPLLKNSGAIVQVRLADDTGYTTIDANHRLQGTAPATSGATGTAGDIRYDADYIYVCTAANTWKRAAIATW